MKNFKVSAFISNATICDPIFQKLISNDSNFDVVIIEMSTNEALLGVGYHFQVPVIAISTSFASKRTVDLVGAPDTPSYIPNIYTDFTDRMTFWERLTNWIYCTLDNVMYPIFHYPTQEKIMKYYRNESMPSLQELMRNVSLVLLNTHNIFGFPRPYPPNMIEIGGIHINKSVDNLSINQKEFLDNAINGTIFFCLGTMNKFSDMGHHQLNAILNAFESYPMMRLMINSNINITIPSHNTEKVFVGNWFPQEAVLAHPNVKLFVTHGGLLSTMESIYYGKPMVGIPVASDQHINMNVAEIRGFGKSVPYSKLNNFTIRDAIERVLSNQR